MNQTIIISPSGNLYGSEYVLLDFLQSSDKQYTVFIKTRGLFYKKAVGETKHIIRTFNSEKTLYLKLIFILFLKNKIKTIYVNEGGHIKYIKILAKIYHNRKFIVHIRIKEDTCESRLGKISENITLVTISEYMSSFLKPKYEPVLIYDLYKNSQKRIFIHRNKGFNISIVGRVTETKQLDNIFPILNSLQSETKIIFNFWGSYNEKEEWFSHFKNKLSGYSEFEFNFKGFNKSKDIIYNLTNLVIHLNTVEPLGRIVFEAIDYNTPIITFNKGGTGELMQMLGLNDFIVNYENDWGKEFSKKIVNLIEGEKHTNKILNAKKIIQTDFSPKNYTNKIEQLF